MLNIKDEYSPLKDLCVCLGKSVPEYSTYSNHHPEYTKYRNMPWDRKLILEQQNRFFDVLTKYDVSLHFIEQNNDVPWQMYTRDTGFVINDKLFYCSNRVLHEREGEIDNALKSLAPIVQTDVVEITTGSIEGGDVLVDQGMAYVGLGARTSRDAVDQLRQYVDVVTLELGANVMHLDTRMTILPNRKLLIYPPAFKDKGLEMLGQKFEFIEVTEAECENLGTNVFAINPETIVAHQAHGRVIEKLRESGFNVEVVDYSEPIAITGSFRCTTMPLVRKQGTDKLKILNPTN